MGGQPTPVLDGTQVGVHLRDDEDLMLEKIRSSTVGEYEVRGLLGRGGMASVFVAYDLTLNRKVALKVMHPGLLGDAGMRERFRLEARMAARLDHPNVVTVHAVKERSNIIFFDLKLIDGTSLDRLLRHRSGPMPVKVARWAIAKIADALHYAHGEGVVHRDMKPANVMVERRGDCIVMDFGIAKAKESPHLTMTGAVVGTPAYMSPEQCVGEEVTASSDQYSLGIMAYEVLTGNVPFTGSMLQIQLGHVEKAPTPIHEIVPEIPKDVSAVVMRMLAKSPADRWPHLADAAEALIEGLGASDAQMRKEMALLVHELPEEAGRALPQTPNSPTPRIVGPDGKGTQPIAAAPRVQDQSTQVMESTVVAAEAAYQTPEASQTAVSAGTRARSRKPFIIAGAAVLVAIIGIIAIKGGGSSAATGAAPMGRSDSAARARVDSVTRNQQLENSDTNIVRVGVNPITATISVGDSLQLAALAFNPTGETVKRTVHWESSDTVAVTVNDKGWIFGKRKTTANERVFIYATVAKRSGTAVVTVK
ncbi:MAG TPA: protein kinase [Gemmatimonadaceae bacterium]|nr:protein kinase [Gemmatimonadaceae bacterium]